MPTCTCRLVLCTCNGIIIYLQCNIVVATACACVVDRDTYEAKVIRNSSHDSTRWPITIGILHHRPVS
eukprot:COSAG02_NODE_442_length_22243_cov_20.572887_14_plen_68_part_00